MPSFVDLPVTKILDGWDTTLHQPIYITSSQNVTSSLHTLRATLAHSRVTRIDIDEAHLLFHNQQTESHRTAP